MRRVSALLLATAACGHLVPLDGGDARTDGMTMRTDAGVLVGTTADASVPVGPGGAGPRRCAPESPFDAPTPVALPELDDRLEAFRLSTSGAGVLAVGDNHDSHEIFAFDRPNETVVGLRSGGEAYADDDDFGEPTLSPDGLLLVVARTKSRTDGDVAFARRAALADPFPAPAPITHAGIDGALFWPYLAGGSLYASRLPRNQDARIVVGSFDAVTGTLTNPRELPFGGLLPGSEWSPVASADERELFFASSPKDDLATVLHATRATAGDELGPPAPVFQAEGLPVFQYPTWLSDDACTLYLIRVESGRPALLQATRR